MTDATIRVFVCRDHQAPAIDIHYLTRDWCSTHRAARKRSSAKVPTQALNLT